MKPVAMKYINPFKMEDGKDPDFTVGETYKVTDDYGDGDFEIETDEIGGEHIFPIPGDGGFKTEDYFEVIYCEED